MPLKLFSLNMEGHKHLGRVISLLQAEKPDVICLQELFEIDIPVLEQLFDMKWIYMPMADVKKVDRHQPHALGKWGVGIFTNLPMSEIGAEIYFGQPDILPTFMDQDNPNAMNRILLHAQVQKDNQVFTVATTHFTWSKEGLYTDEQARDFANLNQALTTLKEFVVCGDLNSPRQGEPENVFNQLAATYNDNIPADVTTSIDGQFHKAGQLELMVDSLFSTPEYKVDNVRVIGGVSDHKAVVGDISRVD
jgi:endonuclease/exonuclease/phosphatase family metal-dependent hydrolase